MVAGVRRQPYSILSSKKNADKWRKKVPSLTVENQKPTAKPLSMRLAVGFIFVLLSGILSIFAFLLNCFHILLCDEFIVCTKSAHIM